jgi:hypothetical protein
MVVSGRGPLISKLFLRTHLRWPSAVFSLSLIRRLYSSLWSSRDERAIRAEIELPPSNPRASGAQAYVHRPAHDMHIKHTRATPTLPFHVRCTARIQQMNNNASEPGPAASSIVRIYVGQTKPKCVWWILPNGELEQAITVAQARTNRHSRKYVCYLCFLDAMCPSLILLSSHRIVHHSI